MNENKSAFGTRFLRLLFYNTESFTKDWEKQKKKGIINYITINTIWAIFTFVTVSFISIYRTGNYIGWEREEAILAASIIGLIAGILTSMMKWLMNDARYREIKNQSN